MDEKTAPIGSGITVVYDNSRLRDDLMPAWGLSVLVDWRGTRVLFDTGGQGPLLLANLKKLGLAPESFDAIFLSHDHWDHAGGLFDILAQNHEVPVWLPAAGFSPNFQDEIRRAGAVCRPVTGPVEICPGLYSTGQIGDDIPEQALVLETKAGPTIITGCAHPGIIRIIEAVRDSFGSPIALVLGGFHLAKNSRQDLAKVIAQMKRLGVIGVAPCHCTGEKALVMFREDFQENFVKAGAGLKLGPDPI